MNVYKLSYYLEYLFSITGISNCYLPFFQVICINIHINRDIKQVEDYFEPFHINAVAFNSTKLLNGSNIILK